MIYRIDVRIAQPAGGGVAAVDPLGEGVRHQIREFGADVGPITTTRIFLIDSSARRDQIARAAGELLADPIVEQATVIEGPASDDGKSRIEIHLKPGVMDPVAASTEMALRDMDIDVKQVRTGRAYVIEGKIPPDELRRIASRVLANGVIESVHFDSWIPREFDTGREHRFELRHVALRDLSDTQLAKLSREGHLFLSLAEMKAVQAYFREQKREPTDIELETIAQTWSEHCVHKTLKSPVDVEVRDATGKVIAARHYNSLIKDTIFASTMRLMERRAAGEFCLSVFADNAGVIAFDETDAICFKVETHNHPSAIEPYGGSATGIGGVIRDILGTGLAARPVANTDVFCVAFPDYGEDSGVGREGSGFRVQGSCSSLPRFPNPEPRTPNPLPKVVIHPKRILQQVVAGVRDYGNRMGIPTVNGAVYFDDGYLGNPLVFCGCVGLIPRDRIFKDAQSGDAIVVVGGRTGRDGIHGATFSSAELTDTHADEFSHAVQIGNAITEKKVADVVLQARDRGLFTAITDCGAGGLSSAVGEMGQKLGARVDLDTVPLKYAGLRYDEIWISEAQERMVLSVPKQKLDELLALARSEDVEATVIGQFGTQNHDLVLRFDGREVGRLSMHFLHHGIPIPSRRAVVIQGKDGPAYPSSIQETQPRGAEGVERRLLRLLSHPNIASKHWIIRQYDHEVQGSSVIKPLTGPLQAGPSDAAVLRPKLDSRRGIAVGCGMAPWIEDPYQMALAAIDEAVRNVVAVGADPDRIAILDNFCWPSADDEMTMGTLVRACEACRDAALAFGIPFISGKDSLNNQFTNSETGQVIRIPNTLLISAIGIVDDVRKCVTMDLKEKGNEIALIGGAVDGLEFAAVLHRKLATAIDRGLIVSCHDCSDGGAAVTAAEMCIAAGLGMDVAFASEVEAFAERNSTYLAEYASARRIELVDLLGANIIRVGSVRPEPRLRLTIGGVPTEVAVDKLHQAWRGTLDW